MRCQQGPYLSGNPTLRSEISQISGTCSCANQEYNGLQATLRKRFSAGLEYQVAFTYSKGMSDSIGYYGQGGQAGSQSAYMQNLYNRRRVEPDLLRQQVQLCSVGGVRAALRQRTQVSGRT